MNISVRKSYLYGPCLTNHNPELTREGGDILNLQCAAKKGAGRRYGARCDENARVRHPPMRPGSVPDVD